MVDGEIVNLYRLYVNSNSVDKQKKCTYPAFARCDKLTRLELAAVILQDGRYGITGMIPDFGRFSCQHGINAVSWAYAMQYPDK